MPDDSAYSLLFLESTASTNEIAQEILKSHRPVDRTVIATFNQTRGKGQRGNTWYTGKDENLAFSIVLLPESLSVADHFLLNKVFSLGIYDFLKEEGIQKAKVKWPNDVLVDDKKIAGILIENAIRGEQISSIIAGIGININQVDFHDSYFIPPVSLKSVTGMSYPLPAALHSLLRSLFSRYDQLFSDPDRLNRDYLNNLYGINSWCCIESDGQKVKGIIRNVTSDGLLEIETEKSKMVTADQRQGRVEYI